MPRAPEVRPVPDSGGADPVLAGSAHGVVDGEGAADGAEGEPPVDECRGPTLGEGSSGVAATSISPARACAQ